MDHGGAGTISGADKVHISDNSGGGNINVQTEIVEVSLLWRENYSNSHWEINLKTSGGYWIKVDLTMHMYRVIYSNKSPDEYYERVTVKPGSRTLSSGPLILGDVLTAVEEISARKGAWNGFIDGELKSGGRRYNCQDFAIKFLKRLHFPDGDISFAKTKRAEAYQVGERPT